MFKNCKEYIITVAFLTILSNDLFLWINGFIIRKTNTY